MRSRLWARAALMLGLLAAPQGASAAVRAVFVGIDHYLHSRAREPTAEFEDLSGAVGDTLRVRAAMAQALALPLAAPGTGCDWRDAVSQTLINQCATRDRILRAWDDAIAASARGDTLVLYFAGHGSRYLEKGGEQASRYNSTLMPTDARDPASDTGTDILDREVRRVIDLATSRGIRVVTLFDSCNSGTASRDGQSASRTAPELRNVALPPEAPQAGFGQGNAWRVHIGAAADGQDAKEVGSVGNRAGVFSTALAKALVAMPHTSFADLAARVSAEVTAATGGRQTPHAEGALRASFDGPEVKLPTFAVVAGSNGLVMDGGQLLGVTRGSRFALFATTSDALQAGRVAMLGTARVAAVAPAMAQLALEPGAGAALPPRLVAVEISHDYGGRVIGLAVNDPGALAVVQQLGFVAVDRRGPFTLTPEGSGLALRGRGGVLLAQLPPASAPQFPVRLASALDKVARVEHWLGGLQSRPGLALCVQPRDTVTADLYACPMVPPGGRQLKLNQPASFTLINQTQENRFLYVFGIGRRYEVTLVMPAFGGRNQAIAGGQPLRQPAGQELIPDDTGPLRFVALSTDREMAAQVLEQSATDMIDEDACRRPLPGLFCAAGNSSRGGNFASIGNWSAALVSTQVVP